MPRGIGIVEALKKRFSINIAKFWISFDILLNLFKRWRYKLFSFNIFFFTSMGMGMGMGSLRFCCACLHFCCATLRFVAIFFRLFPLSILPIIFRSGLKFRFFSIFIMVDDVPSTLHFFDAPTLIVLASAVWVRIA